MNQEIKSLNKMINDDFSVTESHSAVRFILIFVIINKMHQQLANRQLKIIYSWNINFIEFSDIFFLPNLVMKGTKI